MYVLTTQSRRGFLSGLGTMLAAPGLCGPLLAAEDDERTLPADALRIMNCNIRVALASDCETGNGWESRKELCGETIAACQPDVICFQECKREQLQDLTQYLPHYRSFAQALAEPPFHPVNGILFAKSRFTMLSGGGFSLSETPHIAGSKSWDSALPRFVNWVFLHDRRSKKSVRIWNTHFDHKGQRAREEAARLIVEASNAYPDDTCQLLSGDLNADASNAAIKSITDGGWIDTYAATHGHTDPGFTFHRFLGPKYGEVKKNPLGKIDWIFSRGPVKTLAAEIIRKGRDGRYPSDHYFVVADVLLQT